MEGEASFEGEEGKEINEQESEQESEQERVWSFMVVRCLLENERVESGGE